VVKWWLSGYFFVIKLYGGVSIERDEFEQYNQRRHGGAV
jgi:hypothetical protein